MQQGCVNEKLFIFVITKMNIDLDNILKEHGLRRTAFRKELLQLFYDSRSSLSTEEIKKKAGATNDKVTIYRALDSFEKSGLIHRVPDKSNLTRYALCNSKDCSSNNHTHNHAHFICNDCNETFCLDDIEVPVINKTKGFKISDSNLTLQGSCPDCNS